MTAAGSAPPSARAALPPLARSTLDRAAHRRTDQRWLDRAWERARVLVVDVAAGGRALVRTGEGERPELVLLGPDVAPAEGVSGRLFLGVDGDGVPVFAVDAPLPELAGARAVTLRHVGHLLTVRDAGLFVTAVALANWHALHRYSPATGRPTTVADGGWARLDGDGRQIWPRTDPAMIVLVHDGATGPDGRCLLGSNAAWPVDHGVRRFSCLAGFVEPGESAEAAVIREVGEEVGLEVTDLGYVGSQSWPYPGSLMLGFLARADPRHPLRLDPTEIAHARWLSRRQVAAVLAGEWLDAGEGLRFGLPPPSSIALFLIERWLSGPAGQGWRQPGNEAAGPVT